MPVGHAEDGGIPKGDTLACPPLGCFFFCHFFLHKQKEMAHNLSGIYHHRHCEEAEGRRGNPFSTPGAIFFLLSQKEYGKKKLPREGLVETAPPLEPTPVCISSHRHMPGDAFAAYCGGIQVMPRWTNTVWPASVRPLRRCDNFILRKFVGGDS